VRGPRSPVVGAPVISGLVPCNVIADEILTDHPDTGRCSSRAQTLERITAAILAGKITVPIAAVFPVEQIRDAVTLQAARHVHGKIVVTL
jgi:NADPH:quinone reductase-like Zn-dependent oxidoreductase